MTVFDTSVVIDFLLGDGVAAEAAQLLAAEGEAAAPDLLVFEVLAVLRRHVNRDGMSAERASAAISDLGDVALQLYPSTILRERAWALRDNLTAGDALFAALAQELGEPLATKDRGLATVVRSQLGVPVVELG